MAYVVRFMRTCQECFHKQQDTDPKGNPTTAFDDRKCRRCSSSALDYGSYEHIPGVDDE